MKKLLIVAAFIEALTGLLLFVNPRIVVQFLLGAQITGVGALMSRVAGISLIALGVACFPASNPECILWDVDLQRTRHRVSHFYRDPLRGRDSSVASCCGSLCSLIASRLGGENGAETIALQLKAIMIWSQRQGPLAFDQVTSPRIH